MAKPVLIELLRGKGAHVDPLACVEDLSLELARRQVPGFPNTIGQLVFHMNYWMDYELRRIQAKSPAYPEHNAESFPLASSLIDLAEWDRLRTRLAFLLNEFAALATSSPQEMEREIESVYEGNKNVTSSLEAVLWQIVAHNSYHVGQIAMIRRALGAWPPLGGGDTW